MDNSLRQTSLHTFLQCRNTPPPPLENRRRTMRRTVHPPLVHRFDFTGQHSLHQYFAPKHTPQSISNVQPHPSSDASGSASRAVTVASLWRSSTEVKHESPVSEGDGTTVIDAESSSASSVATSNGSQQRQSVEPPASHPAERTQTVSLNTGTPANTTVSHVDVASLVSGDITTTFADTQISSDAIGSVSNNKNRSSPSSFAKQRCFLHIKHRRYRQKRMLARYFWMSVRKPVLSLQSKDISLRLETLYEKALRASLRGESKLLIEAWTSSRSRGGGRISLYWRLWGFPVLTFDQSEPALNIMLRPVQSLLRRWLQRKVVKFLLLSPPCTTFSASFRKPVLRSTVNPWGRHGLSQKYSEMIDKGNAEGRLALALLCESALCGVDAALQHPSTSFLLRTPEIHVATTKFGFLQHEFHQCLYYGATLKKITFLTTSSCAWVYNIGSLCSNADGKCDRTGKKHRRMSALRPVKGVISSDAMAKDIASFSALADIPL